jgi:hypothetical protein
LAQAAVITQALADAEAYGRRRTELRWADCDATPAGTCGTHLDDLHQSYAYRNLAAELVQLLLARRAAHTRPLVTAVIHLQAGHDPSRVTGRPQNR